MSEGVQTGASSPVALAATPLQTFGADWKGHTMHRSTDTLVNAIADQIEAENAEAKRLAPHNRFLLSDPQIRHMAHHALAGRDDYEVSGVAPIIRCASGLVAPSTEHIRRGTDPLQSSAPQRYCNVCNKPTNRTVPFWVARGRYIVQIDACDRCAAGLMDRGAVPQLGLLEE